MGREASCHCNWAGEAGTCKVLLESTELIVRGVIRRRVALSALREVSVEAEQLTFRVDGEDVSLRLGSDVAQRWAKALAAPPPSLAKKLGISRASNVLLIGEIEGDELKAAVAEAAHVNGKDVNLILACVNTNAELDRALEQANLHAAGSGPIWVIYPKGSGQRISESAVRESLLSWGFIDTKVASVSAKLTALRFLKRAG
jgi:hypothetical protein